MKQFIFLLVMSCTLALSTTSCKEKGSDHATEMHEDNDKDVAMHTHYQCPMDCEKGKTYDAEGTCPVCQMDLKQIEHGGHDAAKKHSGEHKESNHDDHEEHDHD